jgi:type IV secretion system protein VirB2
MQLSFLKHHFTINNTTSFYIGLALLALLMLAPQHACASVGSGGSLPYEDWLTNLRDSVTGPVAFTLSIVGIVVAGGILIFGGELNGFFRTMIFIVLVMALLVGAQNMLSSFFGRGAEIASISTEVHLLARQAGSIITFGSGV